MAPRNNSQSGSSSNYRGLPVIGDAGRRSGQTPEAAAAEAARAEMIVKKIVAHVSPHALITALMKHVGEGATASRADRGS